MTRQRLPLGAAIAMLLLLLGACSGDDDDQGSSTSNTDNTSTAPARANPDSAPPDSTAPGAQAGASMDITLVTDDTELRATLDDSDVARDFTSMLPLTLTISDHNSTEKVADLPRPLNTDGSPDGITPTAGDMAFYAPWGNLALFYRDFDYSDGLVSLGRFEPEAIDVLADLDDGTTITIDLAATRWSAPVRMSSRVVWRSQWTPMLSCSVQVVCWSMRS